jgi:hypothetical protein
MHLGTVLCEDEVAAVNYNLLVRGGCGSRPPSRKDEFLVLGLLFGFPSQAGLKILVTISEIVNIFDDRVHKRLEVLSFAAIHLELFSGVGCVYRKLRPG